VNITAEFVMTILVFGRDTFPDRDSVFLHYLPINKSSFHPIDKTDSKKKLSAFLVELIVSEAEMSIAVAARQVFLEDSPQMQHPETRRIL